jgi:hypothetical protein
MPTATVAPDGTVLAGMILPDVLYTLDAIKARLGVRDHAMRMMRRRGLKVRYLVGRGYVMGRDVIEHVEAMGKPEK